MRQDPSPVRRSKAAARWPARLLTASMLCVAVAASAAEPSEFSPAEKLVFTDPHLVNVKTPTSLRYSFVKSGSLEGGFEDEVRLDVTPNPRGQNAVKASFLSEQRREAMPEIEEAQSNPAILYFLEHDIREMERLTKGKSNYFRKRIRIAMAESATVRDTTVQYRGQSVTAKEVTLLPYEKDPNAARFEKYTPKRYVFVLASGVPGGLYQIRTSLPGALPSDAPVLEETMTLAGTEPATKAASTAAQPTAPKKKP